MTSPRLSTQVSASGETGGDAYLRRAGRAFIFALYGALRSIKLYPLENAAVQRALDELSTVAAELLKSQGEVELRASNEFIFVNATRLRLDLDNYASFSH